MTPIAQPAVVTSIASESRRFLTDLFSYLRDDLADQADVGGPSSPDPENVTRTIHIVDALLDGLRGNSDLPRSDKVCEYVTELAKATDEENEYERVALEHRALVELSDALAKRQ